MKPLTKNLWRNIRDSLGRFIAIVIIIMLGVLLFVGVKATGPALKDSLNTTVKADHLADSQLLARLVSVRLKLKPLNQLAACRQKPSSLSMSSAAAPAMLLPFTAIKNGQPSIDCISPADSCQRKPIRLSSTRQLKKRLSTWSNLHLHRRQQACSTYF